MECLQDLETEVRDLIDEPSSESEEWPSSNSLIVGHINKTLTRKIAVAIRKRCQDYFGIQLIIPLVTDQYEYVIPKGQIRSVDLLKSGVTDNGNSVYTVSKSATRIKLERLDFNEKDEYNYYPQLSTIIETSGYYQFGNKVVIGEGTRDVTTGYYLRVWMIPSLYGLHYGTVTSTGASTLVISSATKGEYPKVSNAYLGYGVKIYSGTGIGQERQIIGDSYNSATSQHTLTLDTAWGTEPSSAVYSITAPIDPEFEEALVFGAALRAKFKVEDPQSELYQWYKESLMDALNMITPRNRDGVRRIKEV